MSAHRTCLQGHTWPMDDDSDVCPVCGTRPLGPATAVVEDELPVSAAEKTLARHLIEPEVVTAAQPSAPQGWPGAALGAIAVLALLLLATAVGLGWLTVRARDHEGSERERAEAAEKLAAKNADDARQAHKEAGDA